MPWDGNSSGMVFAEVLEEEVRDTREGFVASSISEVNDDVCFVSRENSVDHFLGGFLLLI